MEPISVERDVWIAAPLERVWDILTDPHHMEQWWGDQWQFSSRSEGGTVTFGEGDEASHAMIAVFDAPHRFVLQWQAGVGWPAITSEFTLLDDNNGTRLHVCESGFEQFDEDVRQQRIDGNEKGYQQVLSDLKAHVEAQHA